MSQARTIEVVPHQAGWSNDFVALADEIAQALGDQVVDIHHIGSTAVMGLCAKPIIDLLPVVQSVDAVDRLQSCLETRGYEGRGEYGLSGRRYFIRWREKKRVAHVHIYSVGHPAIQRHLAFRDYLRAHPAVATEYGHLKASNARLYRRDPEAYCAAKNAFVKDTEARALAWTASHIKSACQ